MAAVGYRDGMRSAEEIKQFVEEQMSLISNPDVRGRIREGLVDPYPVHRDWDYGLPDQKLACWTVFEHKPSNTSIAFCEEGFGPKNPWGLVYLSGQYMSIGMDSSWYITLEQAFRESMAWSAAGH